MLRRAQGTSAQVTSAQVEKDGFPIESGMTKEKVIVLEDVWRMLSCDSNGA